MVELHQTVKVGVIGNKAVKKGGHLVYPLSNQGGCCNHRKVFLFVCFVLFCFFFTTECSKYLKIN